MKSRNRQLTWDLEQQQQQQQQYNIYIYIHLIVTKSVRRPRLPYNNVPHQQKRTRARV